MYYQYTIVVCVFNVIPCSSYVLKQTDGLTLNIYLCYWNFRTLCVDDYALLWIILTVVA